MSIARFAGTAIIGLVLLVGAMLLVRPLIFSVAPERGDRNYVVAAAAEVGNAPLERTIVLNQSHGLAGEQPNGRHPSLRVLVSTPAAGGVAVVGGWSGPGCGVEVTGDRLTDCRGATWTFDGVPIDAPRALPRFPANIVSGAVVVDFTRLIGPS